MSVTARNRRHPRHRAATVGHRECVGFRLHAQVIKALRSAVAAGEAPSADDFVEGAIISALRALRRRQIYRAYEEAAQDPTFLADMAALSEPAKVRRRRRTKG